jgi:hypothetical protein
MAENGPSEHAEAGRARPGAARYAGRQVDVICLPAQVHTRASPATFAQHLPNTAFAATLHSLPLLFYSPPPSLSSPLDYVWTRRPPPSRARAVVFLQGQGRQPFTYQPASQQLLPSAESKLDTARYPPCYAPPPSAQPSDDAVPATSSQQQKHRQRQRSSRRPGRGRNMARSICLSLCCICSLYHSA